MKKVLFYEPWNLGDVAISLHFITQIDNSTDKLVFYFCCKFEYVEFVNTTKIFEKIFGFSPNWTNRFFTDKYNIFKYNFKQIINLKNELKNENIDTIILVRKDLRSYLLFKLLFGNKVKIYQSKLKPINGGYDNFYMFKKIFLLKKNEEFIQLKSKIENIIIFRGASDFNRKLPLNNSINLIDKLIKLNFKISLIISNVEEELISEKFKLNPHFNIIKGSIVEVTESIKKNDLLITTDSGWLHIANLFNIKTISLFGFDNYNYLPENQHNFLFTPKKILDGMLRYKSTYLNIQPLENLNIDELINFILQKINLVK